MLSKVIVCGEGCAASVARLVACSHEALDCTLAPCKTRFSGRAHTPNTLDIEAGGLEV